MATERIGTAILEIATNSAKFKTDLEDIKASSESAFSGLRATAGVVAAAFAAIDLGGLARDAVTAGSDIADASQRIGDSAEVVQRLTFAVKQGGASFGDVETAIKKMADVLGSKGAGKALEDVGLTFDDIKGKRPGETFTIIADAIAQIPDPLRQSDLATNIFGKTALTLFPAIKAGITDVGGAATVMSDETVAALDKVGDKWDETQNRLNNIKAEALAPLLELFASMPQIFQTIVGGIATFMPSLEALALGLLAIGGPAGAMAALTTAGTVIVTFFTVTLPAAFTSILPFLGPIGLIAAGITAVVVVWKNWDTIGPIVKNVYLAVKEWLVDKFNAVVEGIKAKVDAVTGFFKGMYDKVVGNSYVPDMLKGIQGEFAKLDRVMVRPAMSATEIVETVFRGMTKGITDDLTKWTTGMASTLTGFMGGGSSVLGGILQGGLAAMLGPAGPLAGLISSGISALASKAMDAARSLWHGIQGIFGTDEEARDVNPHRDEFIAQYGGDQALGEKILNAYMAGGASYDESEAARIELMDRMLYAAQNRSDFDRAQEAVIDLIGGRRFAKGGIVMRPLMGLVGEKGPEAVIPLDRLPSMPSVNERPIEVTIQLDGLTLAKAVQRHWPRALSHAGLA